MKRTRPRPLQGRATVTVVVPCYNYGHFLPELVARLLAEPGSAVDVVIVDDCSPDGSADVARELAATHTRVSAICHPANKGHIATYNDGLAVASGEFVVLLSADDLLPIGAIDRAVALMQAHPSVGLVYGWAQSFEGEPPPDGPSTVRSWSVWNGREWLARRCANGRNVILSPEVVMRTAALRDAGGYDARLPQAADLDLWLKTAVGWDVGRINGPEQAWYRVHGANMHLTQFAGDLTDLRERRLTFATLYDEHARHSPDILRRRRDTMAALARQGLEMGTRAVVRGDADLAEEFAAFAVETWPDIKATRAWDRYEKRRAGGMSRFERRAFAVQQRVSMHLRWRLGRRYGR